MTKAEQLAKYLLDIGAVKFSKSEPFVWTSGLRSPIYVDNRSIISFPVLRDFVLTYAAEVVYQEFSQVQYIAAVATGAIPLAAMLADRLNLPLVYVRSKPKEHGLKKMIEGYLPKNVNVLVYEDLVSTGQSSANVVKVLRDNEVNVIGLIANYSYQLPQAEETFENLNLKTYFLTNFSTLIEQAKKSNFIDNQMFKILKNWHQKPEKF